MSSFDREVCHRLPLADAAFRLLDYILDDATLEQVYEHGRGRSYQDILGFPTFVRLVGDALLAHRGSAHQCFCKAREEERLDTVVEAVYGKLRRVPVPLTQDFFRVSAARLQEVLPTATSPLPESLTAFEVLRFDGKKLKHVVKRLKPLRSLKGQVVGGKLLVVQNVATQQVLALEATEHGEAADNPLVPGAVAQVRSLAAARPRLWIGDRAFCEFKTLSLLATEPDHVVVRYHARCRFHPDPAVPARTGRTAQGWSYREEWGWLGDPQQRRRVRRITLDRPHDTALIVVTSLLDADAYPAEDLLTIYHRRWGIESLFLRVTQTFHLRHLISGAPRATVFQGAFCLLLYNVIVAIQGYLAVAAERVPESISTHNLFGDLKEELTAWTRLLDVETTCRLLRDTHAANAAALKQYLHQTLARVWTERWVKAKTTQRPPPGPPRWYLKGGHSSAAKILRGEHEVVPIKSRKKTAPASAIQT
jgi:DDE family transposase